MLSGYRRSREFSEDDVNFREATEFAFEMLLEDSDQDKLDEFITEWLLSKGIQEIKGGFREGSSS